jgi:hypothetical protein
VSKPNRRSVLNVIATTVAGSLLRPAHAAESGPTAPNKESGMEKTKVPDFQGALAIGRALGLTLPDSATGKSLQMTNLLQ